MIHTVKVFGVVNKADVFLELSYFLYDPTDVGNLISVSSAFSKSSLNIWKFSVLVLLKPGFKNFEYYFEHWHCLSLGLEWKLTFSSSVATADVFKCTDILSAVLSQHHLLGFEIAQSMGSQRVRHDWSDLAYMHAHNIIASSIFIKRRNWLSQ